MLLTIHNLPPGTRYSDIKLLLETKCGLTELILDNLLPEDNGKKVTVGVADEEDAAILARKINGLYFNGVQLYVEDMRRNKELEQPYQSRPTNKMDWSKLRSFQKSGLGAMNQGPMIPKMVPAPMIGNYESSGMYYMQPGQSSSFTGFGDQPEVQLQQDLHSQYPDYQQNSFENVFNKNQCETGPNWSADWEYSNTNVTPTYVQNSQQCDSSSHSFGNTQSRELPNRDREYNFNGNQFAPGRKVDLKRGNSNMGSERDPKRRKTTPPPGWFSRDRYHSNAGTSQTDSRQLKPKGTTDRFDNVSTTNTVHRPVFDKHQPSSTGSKQSDIFQKLFHKPRYDANSFPQSAVWSDRIDRGQAISNKRNSRWEMTPRENERSGAPSAQNYRPKNRNSPPPKRFRSSDSINQGSRMETPFGKPVRGPINQGYGSHKLPLNTQANTPDVAAALIYNKDTTFRGQAVSSIAQDIIYNLKVATVSMRSRLMRQLKEDIRKRVDNILGDRTLVEPPCIFEMYREKYNAKNDKELYDDVLRRVAVPNAEKSAGNEPDDPQGTDKEKIYANPKAVPAVRFAKPPVSIRPEKIAPAIQIKKKQVSIPRGKVDRAVPAKKRLVPKSIPNCVYVSSEKVPKFPQRDKKKYKEQKQQVIKEFSGEISYEFDCKNMQKMFELESEVIASMFKETCLDPGEGEGESEEYFCKKVPTLIDEFRNVLRLQLSKRLQNIGPILLRVYGNPKLPKKAILDKFLIPYGVISLKRCVRKSMFTATFSTYAAVDTLCAMDPVLLEGHSVSFRPMYVTGPIIKNNRKKLEVEKKQLIESQIDNSDDVNLQKNPVPASDLTNDDVHIGSSDEKANKINNLTKKEDLTEDVINEFDGDALPLANKMTKHIYDKNEDVSVKSEKYIKKDVDENDDFMFYEDVKVDFSNDDINERFHVVDEVGNDDLAPKDFNEEKAVNDSKDEPEVNTTEHDKDVPETNVKLTENSLVASEINGENDSKCTREINVHLGGNNDGGVSFDDTEEHEYPDIDIDDVNDDDLEDY